MRIDRSYEEFLRLRKDRRLGNPKGTKTNKQRFCSDYIKGYVKYLNPIPDKHGHTRTGSGDLLPVYELPFKGPECFHKEFQSYYVDKGYSVDKIPGASTFRRALKDLAVEKFSKKREI